jgi:hypothetical protein
MVLRLEMLTSIFLQATVIACIKVTSMRCADYSCCLFYVRAMPCSRLSYTWFMTDCKVSKPRCGISLLCIVGKSWPRC